MFKVINKFFYLATLSSILLACKSESQPETTTTPPVVNPYPEGGQPIISLEGPRFRVHTGGVSNNAPEAFPQWPDLPEYEKSSWLITQWKKPQLMNPSNVIKNPVDAIDPIFGNATYSYYTESNLSHVWALKNQKDQWVYELFGQNGWLDKVGGSNVFLTKFFPTEDFSSRVDLNFKAKISKRTTLYNDSKAETDGSVVSQFISGMPIHYVDPKDPSKNINLFLQISHADSRKTNFLAPGKMSYAGCYTDAEGRREIVYGDNMPNALGGNGYIPGATPEGELVDYSFNLNSHLCKMLTKTFNCPNGEKLQFPLGAHNLKNWKIGAYYIGIETQDAFAENMNELPSTRGPARGEAALGVQISELKVMKYPAEVSPLCDGGVVTPICQPNSVKSCIVNDGIGEERCSSDGQVSKCLPLTCNAGFELANGKCEEGTINQYNYFCAENKKTYYACELSSSPGQGWVDIGSGCFHLGTSKVCQ